MSYLRIIGHDRVKEFVKKAVSENRLGQSFLFYGPKGVGKFSFALEFAKALQCSARKGAPCLTCSSCQKAESDNHPDILIFGPEEGKRILPLETIHKIQHQASFAPLEGKYRVIIMDDAHLMGKEASNSFLKILEEPYEKVVFILISPSASALLPTILSRCQKIPFAPIHPKLIADYLEKQGVSKEKALLYSRSSQGSLQQALLYSTQSYLEIRNGLIEILLEKEKEKNHRLAQKLAKLTSKGDSDNRRASILEVVKIWISILRDLILLPHSKIPCIHEDQRSVLELLAQKGSPHWLYLLEQAYQYKRMLEKNYYVDLVLEQWIWDILERA